MKFPEHKASLHLTHNDHLSCYETVGQYQFYDFWVSEEEKRLAIECNDCWSLQWYPDTPIGSYRVCAYNLDKLLEYCNNNANFK